MSKKFLSAFDRFEAIHSDVSSRKSGSYPVDWWDALKDVADAGFDSEPGIEFFVPLGHLVEGIIHFRHQVEMGHVQFELEPDEGNEDEIRKYETALGRIGRALQEIRHARVKGAEKPPVIETLDTIKEMLSPRNGEPLRLEQAARMLGFGDDQNALVLALKTNKIPPGIVPPPITNFEKRQNGQRRVYYLSQREWMNERAHENQVQFGEDGLPDTAADPMFKTALQLFESGKSIEQICRLKGLTREEVELLVHSAGEGQNDKPKSVSGTQKRPESDDMETDEIRQLVAELKKQQPHLTAAQLADALDLDVSDVAAVMEEPVAT